MWGTRGLDVAFHTGHRSASRTTKALTGVDLEVVPGAVTAVVGGDGAGKSTLLHALLRRVPATAGTVDMPGIRRIGFQPATSGVWGTLSVAENIEFVGAAYGLTGDLIEARAAHLVERAGLTGARDRLGGQLSGGMRQKLGFCLAMLHEPDVLLLDEPSTGVDPVSRVELWKLVAEAAAGGAAVVMTTTYLDEAERAGTVVVLDNGRVLAAGAPADIRAAVPGRITTVDGPSPRNVTAKSSGAAGTAPQVDRFDRTWRRGTRLHTWDPDGVADPDHTPDLEDAVIALTLASDPAVGSDPAGSKAPMVETVVSGPPRSLAHPCPDLSSTPLVVVDGAVKRFGRFTAVGGVSLTVAPGEVVGLLGANGAGKTTLIRMILGLEAADEGRISVLGSAPSRADRHALGYVPQGLGLSQALSVEQNVEFVADTFGVRDVPPLPEALAAVRTRPVHEIGLGRGRQLAFHCAMLHTPRLLVLDEPTSGVDPLARARLWDIIHAQADAGTAVLVTTHYMQEAEQCSRLEIMSHGLSVAAGSVADIIAGREAVVVQSDDWQSAFEALADAGLPVVLDGRTARVAGTGLDTVRSALAVAGVAGRCTIVPATLEETMVLVDRATRSLPHEGSGVGTKS